MQKRAKCHKITAKVFFSRKEKIAARLCLTVSGRARGARFARDKRYDVFNIVLVEPEIPANTGNISRTCAVTGARLHLVRPLGFDISDRQLRRAGLDYWKFLDVTVYDSIDDFFEKNAGGDFYFATTKGKNVYTDFEYKDGAYFIFGKETKGLPESLLAAHPSRCIRIPMLPALRSLNLSNSAAIVIYEALRQTGFRGFELEGELHGQ